jgi:hypothetical protein
MKRIGHVFDEVTAFPSLVSAAGRAFRANRENPHALVFMHRLEPEVLQLQRELLSGTYQPGPYLCFTIKEPKERIISASPFRDRVVQHAVCAVLEPVLERRFIHDSYACREGRGTHAALARAQRAARSHAWFLKADVSRYFESIDHRVLKGLLLRLFKDGRYLALLDAIIDHQPPHTAPGVGLPIGNLTSQHFANLYLDQLDHFVKEGLGLRAYVRYMDDFLCFGYDKDSLHEVLARVRGFLRERLCLQVKPEKCYVAPISQGIPFLGCRVFPGTLRLSRATLVRCRRKLGQREAACATGRISGEAYRQSVASLLGHIQHADTLTLRRTWFAATPG